MGIAERDVEQRISTTSLISNSDEGSILSEGDVSAAVSQFRSKNEDDLLLGLDQLLDFDRQHGDESSWMLPWIDHGALEVILFDQRALSPCNHTPPISNASRDACIVTCAAIVCQPLSQGSLHRNW